MDRRKTTAQEPLLRLGTTVTVGDWRGTVTRIAPPSMRARKRGKAWPRVTITLEDGHKLPVDGRIIEEALLTA